VGGCVQYRLRLDDSLKTDLLQKEDMINEFLEKHIADKLYTGRYGGGILYHKVDELPHELYDWIKTQYPNVEYIRIGPVYGEGPGGRMEWWIGAWEKKREYDTPPDWRGSFWSEWRPTH
jgi:hypothetical protein